MRTTIDEFMGYSVPIRFALVFLLVLILSAVGMCGVVAYAVAFATDTDKAMDLIVVPGYAAEFSAALSLLSCMWESYRKNGWHA